MRAARARRMLGTMRYPIPPRALARLAWRLLAATWARRPRLEPLPTDPVWPAVHDYPYARR
jgi:hypothetical protein